MHHHVQAKQPNSKMCLVCGLKNLSGLQARFYELDNHELVAIFQPQEEHQSYPGRLHGGIATAILDETIGRAIMMGYDEEIWGVTVEFTTRYRKPVPLDQEIRVVGRVTTEDRRFFEGTGEVLLQDGSVAVEAWGKYLKLPIERIADFDVEEQEWKVVASPEDSDTIQL